MVSEELRKKIESALDKGGLQGVWQEAQKELLEELIEENTSNNKDLGEVISQKWEQLIGEVVKKDE